MDADNRIGCAGSCHSCGQSCPSENGEKKVGFFEKMEEISTKLNDIGEENILKILNETIAEWEEENGDEEIAEDSAGN